MIRPSKDAERYKLVLDPVCPKDKVYYQERTWFMHPSTFLIGKPWEKLAKKIDTLCLKKEEARR